MYVTSLLYCHPNISDLNACWCILRVQVSRHKDSRNNSPPHTHTHMVPSTGTGTTEEDQRGRTNTVVYRYVPRRVYPQRPRTVPAQCAAVGGEKGKFVIETENSDVFITFSQQQRRHAVSLCQAVSRFIWLTSFRN
jgi:hypothetical protein